MKNYDDLQRFKEKTQTQDINFRDMSGQSPDGSQQRWALIQQLNEERKGDDVLATGQRIDLAQPQPVKKDAFSSPAVTPLPIGSKPAVKSSTNSLLDSLAASLKPVDTPAAAAAASLSARATAPAAGSLLQQMSAPPAAARPFSAESVARPALVPPTDQAKPETAARFGALFRARPTGAVMLPKDTLLKPLLEKIALCR